MIHRLRGAVTYDRLAAPAAAASAHGLRMGVNLIVIKFIAVLVGPTGLGALGNLMSAATMATLFAGGGILNGITKYVAEFRECPADEKRFLGSALAYGLIVSAVVVGLTLLGRETLSRALFGHSGMAWLVPLLGVTHFLCFVGGGVIATVNGRQQPARFAMITIAGYLGVIPVAFALIRFGGVDGAAVALLAVAASTAVPAAILALRTGMLDGLRPHLNGQDGGRLFRFTCITAASAITFPVTEILIRNQITDTLGLASTGIWQALTRLSGAILGFYTVYLATSHMPRLSAIADRRLATTAVLDTLRIVGPVFAGGALLVYLLRSIIVPMLFSSAFRPMEDIIGWQLLGDMFRVCSYVVAFLGIARAALKIHVIAELTQCALYLGLTMLTLHWGWGLREVAQAYAATYAVYFGLTLVALRAYVRR